MKKMPMRKLDDLDMISQCDINFDPKGITRDDGTDKGILKLNSPITENFEDLEKQFWDDLENSESH